jgi:hypothetical protein
VLPLVAGPLLLPSFRTPSTLLRIMAERGPAQTEGGVHFTRIIGIIRTTAETLGVADSLLSGPQRG